MDNITALAAANQQPMKTKDLTFLAVVTTILAPFFLSSTVYHEYEAVNASHPYLTAFLKFALLGILLSIAAAKSRSRTTAFG